MDRVFQTIVIPTYNGLAHLKDCIEALVLATLRTDFNSEIIVVDDCSTDGTVDWLKREYPDVKIVVQPRNMGFAHAVNAGILASSGEWIALLNNDVIVDPCWISNVFSQDIDSQVGAVATQILFKDQPDIINSAGDEYASCGVAVQWLKGRHVSDDDGRSRCFSSCGGACFYRRSALEKVGFFRQSLDAYYEDVDLGFRLNLAGYHCLYEVRSKCWHVGGASYGRLSWRTLYNSARNREIVFWANMPAKLLCKYALGHISMISMLLLASIIIGGFVPRICGTFAVLGSVRQILRLRAESMAIKTISNDQLERRLWRNWFGGLVIAKIKLLPKLVLQKQY